jgi:hypothetical protein
VLRPKQTAISLRCPDCDFTHTQPQRLLAHMSDAHAVRHAGELPWVDGDRSQAGWTEIETLES